MVYEAYIMIDVEGTGVAELYKVIKAGNVLLDKEKVIRKPFVTFVPLPTPHSFYGNNFADKVVATQNARTVLTRSILDHAMITNNPRYTVVKGGLTNPRELIDNRVGGIVNISRPDAIAPMPQSSLNPFIFQTIQMLDEDKEDTTGVSKISQGLNKDALSQQNSAAMVEQLATMSQQRQKIIARNFAVQFVKPLYSLVYELVCENESQERIVELSGSYVACDPRKWREKRDVAVELHLGYGEQEKEAQKYLALHTLMTSDPNLSKMYQQQNQYELASKIMELSGIKEVGNYLTNPQSLPEEGPDPAVEMQMQMAQKQLELQERQTALAETKAQVEAQISQMKIELEKAKVENQHAIQSDNLDLKEEQLRHKKLIDSAELVLAQQADEITAIA
jgi:DNA-binding transcriptional MerR regulator